MNDKTAIIYARVSTAGQADLSIPTQREECERYIRQHGLRLIKTFEEARSGFKKGVRVAFPEMLDFIRREKPGHLVYLISDRLSRNSEDLANLFRACDEAKHDLVLHDVHRKQSFGILDPDRFEEWAQLEKDVVDNRLYSARMRLRVMLQIRKHLSKGIFPGYAPVGYRNIVGTGRIEIDEERAPLVIKAFNLFATGDYSLDDIWERTRREGLTVRTPKRTEREIVPGRPISRADMWRTLKNPFYTGRFRWGQNAQLWNNRGIDGKGKPTYPPLISQETFDNVQAVFKKNLGRRQIRSGKPFLFRGLLECRHCGCQLVGDGTPGGRYVYYHCTSGKGWDDPDWYKKKFGTKKCPQKIWKEKEITSAVEKALAELEFDKDSFNDLRKLVTGEVISRHAAAEDALKGLRKRRAELENEDDRLWKAWTLGKVKPEDLQNYQRSRDKNKAELEEINGDIQEFEALDDSFVEDGLETLETAKTFLNLFNNNKLTKLTIDNLADRKVLLKAYFRKIIVGDPLKPDPMFEYTWPPKYNGLELVWNEPFNTLFETGIENGLIKKTRAHPVEFPDVFSAKPKKWRGRRDSNSRPPA